MRFFYNFCLKDDSPHLDGDILSGVRRSYFNGFDRVKDKITLNSDSEPVLYDYCIEKDKPMRWSVKSSDGVVLEDSTTAGDGKYSVCFYRGEALYKRILFSRLHTLLRVDYFDVSTGLGSISLEPRKAGGSLCILFDSVSAPQPTVLYPQPDINDPRVAEAVISDFSDYTVIASTDEGRVMFLNEAQLTRLRKFIEAAQHRLDNVEEESFVNGETPILDNINAKDFNIRKNLATGLDITEAEEFSYSDKDETKKTSADGTADTSRGTDAADTLDEYGALEAKPSKLITADGAMYSYYGELDENGNRSGYGRTVTDEGRTAYEGTYVNDKRSGSGTYYYKDGSLCYTGGWLDNARHGVGVGVSSRDGSIHAGKWSSNKPVGNGVRLTSDGEIKFVCKELSDGSTVLMNFLPDDTVAISKYDKSGKKIRENTVSFTDIPEE